MIDAARDAGNGPGVAESPEAAYHPDPVKNRAIQGYLVAGTVVGAAKAAGINRQTWYNWIEADPAFASLVAACREIVTEDLEGEAVRRARESSDTLLIFLLKANRPQKYRDRQTIELVSPDVQSRLARQADVIVDVARELLEPELARRFARTLVNRLRDVWA